MVAVAATSCAVPAPSLIPPTATQSGPVLTPTVASQPVPGGPTLLRAGMTLRDVIDVGSMSVMMALNPVDGKLYYLQPSSGVNRVDLGPPATSSLVAGAINFPGNAAGLTFGPDGTLYVVSNLPTTGHMTRATVTRGESDATGNYTWSTLAATDPYPLSETNFDHLYNGMTVSPDGKWLFVNAGARTDHGEVEDAHGVFPNTRDVPLTTKIFRLPTDAQNLKLPNDDAALNTLGVVYARGTRNAYSMAFAPNGDLFAIDNGPDADYPDELNWIRQGLNYGFPWRFGTQDNKQQFPNYDSSQDKLLNPDFVAVQSGSYKNDPTFPKPPPGITFTDPVQNLGPAATQYRADDGTAHDAAAEGKSLYTFTPHRSPLGLVFVTDAQLPADLRPAGASLSAFVLSFGAAGGTLTDKGQDLLHLMLTKQGNNYQAVTTQIARGFSNPIGSVLIGNHLYVLDYGGKGELWEITFQ